MKKIKLWDRIVYNFSKPKLMFFTHTPGDWCKPGTIHKIDGKNWIVKNLKQTTPTALYNGGKAACFEVMGKRKW